MAVRERCVRSIGQATESLELGGGPQICLAPGPTVGSFLLVHPTWYEQQQ